MNGDTENTTEVSLRNDEPSTSERTARSTPRRVGRRGVLATVLGGLIPLTGCSGLLGGSSETALKETGTGAETETATQRTASVLKEVAVDGTALKIRLPSGADMSRVAVVGPDGESFATERVQPATHVVSVDLLPDYTPGEYHVAATREGTVIDETTISIKPGVEIVTVGVGQNHPDKTWGDGPRWHLGAFATIRNTGSGPETVTNLVFSGTPQPTTEYGSEKIRVGEKTELVSETVLSPGETKMVYAVAYPFMPVEAGCEDTSMRAIVRTGIGEDVTESYHVTMDGDSPVENCNISIEGGE